MYFAPPTMVRTYHSPGAFQADAPQMARSGWQVHSVQSFQPQRGCFGTLFFILFLPIMIFVKPKPSIVVTYQRLPPPMPQTQIFMQPHLQYGPPQMYPPQPDRPLPPPQQSWPPPSVPSYPPQYPRQ